MTNVTRKHICSIILPIIDILFSHFKMPLNSTITFNCINSESDKTRIIFESFIYNKIALFCSFLFITYQQFYSYCLCYYDCCVVCVSVCICVCKECRFSLTPYESAPALPVCADLKESSALIGCLNGSRADKSPGFPAAPHHSALLLVSVCVFIYVCLKQSESV